jgi:hypothetical protein
MSGIQMALMGSGSGSYQLITGSATFSFKGSSFYLYGYSNSPTTSVYTPATFGSISPSTFNGIAIKAIYSQSPLNVAGQANSYVAIFDGNQSAGFFNTLTIDGTPVSGTLSAPSYNGTNDETFFSITLGAPAATLLSADSSILLT